MFSEIPTPPVTTSVPVVGVFQVEPVFVVSLRLPAIRGASVPAKTSDVLVALYKNLYPPVELHILESA